LSNLRLMYMINPIKAYFLLFFGLLGCFAAIGQQEEVDLIVTRSRDSLECAVIKVRSQHIIFIHKGEAQDTLSWDEVDNYEYDFFLKPEEKSDWEGEDFLFNSSNPTAQIAAYGALASASVPRSLRRNKNTQIYDFRNNFAVGYGLGINAFYKISDKLYLGFELESDKWSYEGDIKIDTLKNPNSTFFAREKIQINRLSAGIKRRDLNKRNSIAMNYGFLLGLSSYHRESTTHNPYEVVGVVKSAAIDLSLFVGGEFFVSPTFSFLGDIAYNRAFLPGKPTASSGIYDLDSSPHRERIVIKVGVIYNWFPSKKGLSKP
jgi:hypothetical protein